MANKFFSGKAIAICLLCALFLPPAFSQQKKIEFSQKLEWKNEARALEYKVEIRNSAGKITEHVTKKNSISISMPSGNYEWRVTAFDFLGRASTRTEWTRFTIKKAIAPKATALDEKVAFGDKKELEIPLKTQDTESGSKIELIDESGKVVARGRQQKGKAIFEKVPEGKYKVRVTNPGGRYCETAEIKVAEKSDEQLLAEAEAKRMAEEEARLAEQRQIAAEEARIEEEKRKAQEQVKLAEQKLNAKEKKRRKAQEKRVAEQERKAQEEKRRAEAKQKADEKKALADQKKKASEEKRVAEQKQKAEEKRVAEQERKAREESRGGSKARELYIMVGADYLANIGSDILFMDNSDAIGADIKIEYLPLTLKSLRLGLNLETQVFPLNSEKSYLRAELLFIPVQLNASLFYPIKEERLLAGIQAGGGAIMYSQKLYFLDMGDGYTRDNKSTSYVNPTLDVGGTVRILLAKRFAMDISNKLEFWRIDDKFYPSLTFGILAGLRL